MSFISDNISNQLSVVNSFNNFSTNKVNVTLATVLLNFTQTLITTSFIGLLNDSSSYLDNNSLNASLEERNDHHQLDSEHSSFTNGTFHEGLTEGNHSAEGGGHHNAEACSATSPPCRTGILLPAWSPPVENGETGVIAYRAIVYLLVLAYLLFGVNTISDRMVSAIEVIVAHKRKKRVKNQRGQEITIEEPIWHHVVGHLTVYVIGSSAPEIFLPLIEVSRHHFDIDELGPALILGSGAYHLFLITGVCLASVRETTGKPIREQRVFFVCAAFAIGAYLWLYLIGGQFSPGIIEIWEALMTFCFFPLIVFSAWFAETRMHRIIWRKIARCTGLVKPAFDTNSSQEADDFNEFSGGVAEAERRRRLAAMLKELKATNPGKSQIELEEMAELALLESAPKGAAFYRMQASKAMSGGGNVISKEKIKKRLENEKRKAGHQTAVVINENAQFISFEPSTYTVMESCGDAVVTVQRSGCGVDRTSLTLDYRTLEGSAKFVDDFVEKAGTLEFSPDQTTADIYVTVIDDDEFEEDKEFYVEILNPSIQMKKPKPPANPFNQNKANKGHGHANGFTAAGTEDHGTSSQANSNEPVVPELRNTKATVRILDDDHCGIFHFENSEMAVPDNIGKAKVKLIRSTGARGRIQLPFKIISGSAVSGEDFVEPEEKSIFFDNDQFEAFIDIEIVDKNRIGEMYSFFVELEPPIIMSKPPANPDGNPTLSEPTKLKVGICEDVELNAALDRLLKVADIAELISSTTWSDQFMEAVAFVGGEENNGNASDANSETEFATVSHKTFQTRCKSVFQKGRRYFIYGISLPWKLLAAAVPPARYLHGWVAFLILLALMAFLSSVIGDVATHFGCTVGMKDTVTAVTLIAFGMGLPDTFASRHAAMHEMTADAAIGHITGSNAVNVFFGIGMAWSVASIYHWSQGSKLKMPAGALGFGVTIYLAFAGTGVLVLLLRRLPPIRGELGGPTIIKYLSAAFFVLLWITFVLLLTLESYCVIPGF